MIVSFKIVACILLVKCTGFVSCGFTYDDEYAEINKDNYGFDLSEERHVSAEQPKYNTMVQAQSYHGPDMPVPKDLAITGDDCVWAKYNQYLKPIHLLLTKVSRSPEELVEIKTKEDFIMNKTLSGSLFSWADVCYHEINPLFCNQTSGKCECLEVTETDYKGLIEAKDESYDPLTLRHYKHCRIRIKYGCDPSHLTKVLLHCEDGLFCSKIGECMPSSSEQNRNLLGFTTMLIFTYKFLCL